MKRLLFILVILLVGVNATTQAQDIPTPQSIIFETDMGNDIDDAMALDILYKNMDANRINLLGISVHKNNPHAAEFIDIMNNWYGHKRIPIGVNTAAVTDMGAMDYCTEVCAMNDKDGMALFNRSKKPKFEEAVEMYRRILSAQDDKSVVIVTVGFSTTMAALLKSQADNYSAMSGKELVERKVKYFSIMAGEFDNQDHREFNIEQDIEAAKYFFENSPVPFVVTPFKLGTQVLYPAKSIVEDFEWGVKHPFIEAYKSYKTMPYDCCTFDVIATYYACHPETENLTLSEEGEVEIYDGGKTRFIPKKDGRFRILTANEEQCSKIREYFISTLTTKPRSLR